MVRYSRAWRVLAVSAALGAQTCLASADCARLGFAVNDYGKEGPTKDAQELLDKHIADWAKREGIASYTTGKKDVTCELFLDFGFFDEHTCKAEATVCWPDAKSSKPSTVKGPSQPPAKAKKASPTPKKTTPASSDVPVRAAANN